jgi:AmmeMemoRadiSam system protein A/AmmeMemoRadiSam system protein B
LRGFSTSTPLLMACWELLLANAMAEASAIVFSGIAPHPPIMVAEVGREATAEVRASIAAMGEFTRRIVASGAETVVLISPHAPLDASAFVAYNTPQLYGDFANFRAASTHVEFSLDEALLEAIGRFAVERDYEVIGLDNFPLDHGTAVPLYFLERNGWSGSVVALGYSFLSNDHHFKFGECIRTAADSVGRPVAFIASGDLSHRLKPDAPAGYEPAAHHFDYEVVNAIRADAPKQIMEIDPELRQTAGECGYRSMLVALGAINKLPLACEVLSYEAPFGVGYLVAQLTNSSPSKTRNDRVNASADREDQGLSAELPTLARRAVETFVRTGKQIEVPDELSALLSVRAPCFVSIKTSGDLRGCIGTVEPVKDNLAQELIANAINAATRDPRFDPISAEELANLRYSVDILGTPEPATLDDLDPKVYGVIVEDESERRRGLLLPDIPGVEGAAQQVEIAARKAGIPPGTPLKLARFRVDRFRE